MGIKNAELDADFKAVEKVHNIYLFIYAKKLPLKKVMKQNNALLHSKAFGL